MSTAKERISGFLLMCLIVPLAVLGYLIICFYGFFGRTSRVRAGVRALDNFVNATVFDGYAWESVSSHAWRDKEKWWARVVIKITDNMLHKGHCEKANKREQPLVELIRQRKLDKQTIF